MDPDLISLEPIGSSKDTEIPFPGGEFVMADFTALIIVSAVALVLLVALILQSRRQRGELARLQSFLTSAEGTIGELNAEVEEIRGDREALEKDFRDKAQQLQSQAVETEESLRQTREALQRHESTVEQLTSELEKCNAQLLEHEGKAAALEQLGRESEQWKITCSEAEQSLEQTRQELDEARASLATLEAQNQTREQEGETRLRLREQQVLELQSSMQRRDEKIHGLNDEIDRLQMELQQKSGSTEEKDFLIAHWQKRYTSVISSVDHYKEEAKKNYTTACAWMSYAENRQQAIDQVTRELETLKEEHGNERQAMRERNRKLAKQHDALQTEHAAMTEKAEQLEAQIHEMETALAERGRIWEQPYPESTASFQPLTDRHARIITVMSPEPERETAGLTANLGAMLAEKGAKVLLIDLDARASMAGQLFNAESHREQLTQMSDNEQHVQRFLTAEKSDEELFGECIVPLGERFPTLSLMVRSEPRPGTTNDEGETTQKPVPALEDVEKRLFLDWINRNRADDVRLLLRKVLHSPLLCDRFDYVLLNCSGRFSTTSVNALVASDFVLLPVRPDPTTLSGQLPRLLHRLHDLKEANVLSDLLRIGVVASDVEESEGDEQGWVSSQAEVWHELPTVCEESWEDRLMIFDAYVRKSDDFTRASENLRAGKSEALAYQVGELGLSLDHLIDELEEVLPLPQEK